MKLPTFVQFVTRVLRVPLTPAQRVLAAVAFDGVEPRDIEGEDRDIAEELFGPVEVFPESARSILVAVLGARGGKSYIFVALYSLWRALFADLSTLAPGELGIALIVAPDMRLARQSLRYVSGALKTFAPGYPPPQLLSSSSDSILLRRYDGREVSIEVLPASRGGSALRGRSLVSACLDECAFFRDENAVVCDVETFRAVAPRVLPGGLVVCASTPWLESGLLFDYFSKNHGTPTNAVAAVGPTLLMLPSKRNQETVAREEENDPDNAMREYHAQFVIGGSSQFFGGDVLKGCTIDDEPTPDVTLEAEAFLGGDLGLVKDPSAFVACHRARSTKGVVVADILEMRPRRGAPLLLSDVVARGAAMARHQRVTTIWVDHHVLQPAREHLPPGISLHPVPGGQAAKAERFIAVRQAMKEGRLLIPKRFARLRSQLADIYSKPTPGGGLQIIQRRKEGVHGDVASAFILSAWAALRSSGLLNLAPRERKERDEFTAAEPARRMTGF